MVCVRNAVILSEPGKFAVQIYIYSDWNSSRASCNSDSVLSSVSVLIYNFKINLEILSKPLYSATSDVSSCKGKQH